MAAYAKSLTISSIQAIIESGNNVQDKLAIERLFTAIIAEMAAAETAGLAGYTVTTGLQSTLEQTLLNVTNVLRAEFLRTWITFIVTEFSSVETNGLGYTVTTDATHALNEFKDLLDQAISYMPDLRVKQAFHAFNTLLNTEFGLMAAAS